MDVYIIHQYFKTPADGGGIRSYHISRYLIDQGHNVKVITAYNGKNYESKIVDGIEVHYLPVYYTNHLSFLSRVHAFYRFVWMAVRLLIKIPSPDFNYVISTPLSTGIIALYLKWRKKTPFIFEVGDLWPEAPIQLNVIRNPALKWLSRWLEKNIYKRSESIVALSPDIKKEIQKIVPNTRIEIITNIADTAFFKPMTKPENLVEKYDVAGQFVIAYTGTVGLANNLEYLLDAAEICLDESKIKFLVMGAGARWDHIKILAQKRRLSNIEFIESGDKQSVREVLSVSDAIYISFKNAPVLGSGSPNKFFDGLAAGKLVIINFNGWIKDIVERYDCGFSYDPFSPEVFKEKTLFYLNEVESLHKTQCNARTLAQENFSPEMQLSKLDIFLPPN